MDEIIKRLGMLMKMPPVCDIAYNTFCTNAYGLDAKFPAVGEERTLK